VVSRIFDREGCWVINIQAFGGSLLRAGRDEATSRRTDTTPRNALCFGWVGMYLRIIVHDNEHMAQLIAYAP
jgi:hypothetical protein